LGALHLDSRNHEVRNPDEVRSPLWGQPLLNVSGFDISGIFEDKGSGFFVPRFPKSRNAITISANRHFGFRQLKGRETRKEKSRSREIRSSKIAKGVIILFDQEIWVDASCLITRAHP
jgi:hypothetical protein